ncbi:hypothetical protein K457DRAFT_1805530 [Linnemannia elongata AG-77]|uniref:ubiquitinyl hydrolase 1 n=1 Tax=Linnemannia elongata AG-77 TaxID=1314771 RepID=A0A197JQ24_9FUNG|nr:hypothetical protein K457DRAFT_1805530 [Linnemannia elongata AG-77]
MEQPTAGLLTGPQETQTTLIEAPQPPPVVVDDQETVPSLVPIVETSTEAVATTPPPQEVNPAVQTDLTVEVPTQQSQPEPPEQPTHEAHHVDEQVAPTNGNTQESVPGEQQEPAQVNGATTEQETVGTMNDTPAAPVEQEVATDQELAVQPVEIIVQEAAVDDAPAEEAVVVDAAVAIAAGDEAPAGDAPAVDALAVEAPAANEPAANPDAVEEAAADAPADGEVAEAADDAESDDDDDDDAAEATPEFFHRCDDAEWMTRKHIPLKGELEERTCVYHEWRIDDWAGLDRRTTSPEFVIGGYKWRLLVFPRGNNTTDQVAVYLDSAEPQGDDSWHVCAQFALIISNPDDPTVHFTNSSHHRFNNDESDWGFTKFYAIAELERARDSRGISILNNNRLVISTYVRVYKDPTGLLWQESNGYDSKASTGFVGLENQGATCYMNSMLQSLYFTNYFRKAVYDIATDEEEPSQSVALALQHVFYQLSISSKAVSTKDLTQSFGWDEVESFRQHDVQEFNRVLQESLEQKMRGTKAEGAIQYLFGGKTKSFVKCLNVEYESSLTETFCDIQLNVKGCATLRDSFIDYVKVETLDGDNQYYAEGHGLQDAKKGVTFESLPPVLHLHLKRFEYSPERQAMVKINDRHEYPEKIDLAEFVADGEQKEKLGEDGYKYSIYGVLVHSGVMNRGHYFALLKPQAEGNWYRFNDDTVTQGTLADVLEDNYGSGDPEEDIEALPLPERQAKRQKRVTNAYMLIYIRDSAVEEILKPVTAEEVPEKILKQLEEERKAQEAEKKAKEEALLCFDARVVSDNDFRAHNGFDLYNTASETTGKALRVKKKDTYASFKRTLAEDHGIPEDQLRVWTLVKRQNDTFRTDVPIPDTEAMTPMEAVREKYGTRTAADLKCYLEIPERPIKANNGRTSWFQNETYNGNIMIFVKFYDPFTTTMRGLGKLYVHKQTVVGDIVGRLNEMKGFPAHTSLKLFEEIKPSMIEPMKVKLTFHQCEIQGGDIIVFQKELTQKETEELEQRKLRATVPQYFDYIHNRLMVEFKPKTDNDAHLPTFLVELSKKNTYDEIAAVASAKLEIDPLFVQFTSSSVGGVPKKVILKDTKLSLEEILSPGYVQGNEKTTLFYQKLDMSIVELETKRMFKVTWLSPTLKKESTHEMLLPKAGNIAEVIEELEKRVTLSPEGTGKIRMFSLYESKIQSEFDREDPKSDHDDQNELFAEEIPKEEAEKAENDKLLSCFHFSGECTKQYGIPFKIVVKEGELFSETKVRIRARLGMEEEDFEKVKFVINDSSDRITPVKLDDKLSEATITENESLGLDHVEKKEKLKPQPANPEVEAPITISG